MNPIFTDVHEVEACDNHGKCIEDIYQSESARLVQLACALGRPDIRATILYLREPTESKHRKTHPIVRTKNHHSLANRRKGQAEDQREFSPISIGESEEKSTDRESNIVRRYDSSDLRSCHTH